MGVTDMEEKIRIVMTQMMMMIRGLIGLMDGALYLSGKRRIRVADCVSEKLYSI